MEFRKIYILFKTHLDIGFTDLSANVVRRYMDTFIPNAIAAAKELKESGSEAGFVWTVGSWLIDEYVRTHSGEELQRLEKAIADGDICWHGLPFTTHTELMSKGLFEYGVSIAKRLDEKYGKQTIAAKMTDVPGHTKAIIPIMKKAGIEFLHIGVNPASAVPEVPELFRWQADNGDEILVMYNADYGTFAPLGDSGAALYFAHTGDNNGGQSAQEVRELFASLREKFPNTELVPATLNDVALELRKVRNSLPLITDEIGDSWIHGVGTDPKKVSGFRALERFAETLTDEKDRETLYRGILMVPEHTWGMDSKKGLGDYTHFGRDEFVGVRGEANFRRMEASWAEQRRYLTDAVEGLSPVNREKALALLAESQRAPLSAAGMRELPADETVRIGQAELRFDERGALSLLKFGDRVIADDEHRMGMPFYERFSMEEYRRFYGKYNRLDVEWAQRDFTKPGMELAGNKYRRLLPEAKAYTDGKNIVVKYAFPKEDCGCPETMDLRLSFEEDRVMMDYAWFGKSADRVTEALWIGFAPMAKNKRISKLGTLIDPKKVIYKGNRRLHATDFGVVYDGLEIETVDTALVAPGKPALMDFVQELPEDGEEIAFNLFNTMWGTNFPLWYEEDARFRFVIHIK